MFELQQLSYHYGAEPAIDRLSLRIMPGRTTVLIGPSGCGKSTLLRMLIGLLRPSGGEIRHDGVVLTPALLPELRRRVGYVIQDGGLFPHMSARDNITLMARYLRWPARRLDDRLDELCTLTHFPRAALDRFPLELSGGQQQRVALMRALMLDPEALLLDEPLGSLDPMIRHELQEELAQVFATLGKTVVLVTHDLAEAGFLGDHIVLLRAGRLVQQGKLAELLATPADDFVRRFTRAQRGLPRQPQAAS